MVKPEGLRILRIESNSVVYVKIFDSTRRDGGIAPYDVEVWTRNRQVGVEIAAPCVVGTIAQLQRHREVLEYAEFIAGYELELMQSREV